MWDSRRFTFGMEQASQFLTTETGKRLPFGVSPGVVRSGANTKEVIVEDSIFKTIRERDKLIEQRYKYWLNIYKFRNIMRWILWPPTIAVTIYMIYLIIK